MTTFVTLRGLYRYTRLMFGVTSAPENYQQIIRDALRGCEGVINITDDVAIHGNDVEQNNERLFVVLNRLKEVGLTLNGHKSGFSLPRLTFFGHQVTQNGVELVRRRSQQSRMQIHHRTPARHSHSRAWLNLCVSSFQTCPLLQHSSSD